jgi:hypothetical protein
MAEPTTPRVLLSGLAIVSAGYALLGLAVFGLGTYRPNAQRRRIGRYLAIASPLPVVCFGILTGAIMISPPALQLVLWIVVVLGAWGPILLSPAIAVAFLLDR